MATAKKALVIEAALQDGTDASRLAQSLVYDAGVDTPEQDSRSCWQHRPGCQLKYRFPPQTAGARQVLPAFQIALRGLFVSVRLHQPAKVAIVLALISITLTTTN